MIFNNGQGFGLGLRSIHIEEILAGQSSAQWFEALTENYMRQPGMGYSSSFHQLEKVRSLYPIHLHGVSLGLGNATDLDSSYLQSLKELVERIEPLWVSDHLCWTGVGKAHSHDLLPLPYTEEALELLVRRLHFIQDFLKRPFAIENVSSYLQFEHSTMPEWEFLAELLKRSGCSMILDVNNIYVSSVNHNFSPDAYLRALPSKQVAYVHMAGHTVKENLLIDTHDKVLGAPVLQLYERVLRSYGNFPSMVEWDANIPSLKDLEKELEKLKSVERKVYETRPVAEPSL